MQLTLNKWSGLRALRVLRAAGELQQGRWRHIELVDPDPSPKQRWNKQSLERLGFEALRLAEGPSRRAVSIAVSSSGARIQSSSFKNTVYSETVLPKSFMRFNSELVIPCPELLFVEMATCMDMPQLVMLGYELCGSFSRNPVDPRNGRVTMGVAPVTSVAQIQAFIEECMFVRGMNKAREALEYCADHAWSPTESVVATVMSLPAEYFGYGLAPLKLNQRVDTPESLEQFTQKGSRVPDIVLAETNVGINYDGVLHLDLDSIVNAAIGMARNPGSSARERELNDAVQGVRSKVIDDIRRNRELAASGFTVFPVVKEDLYMSEGLDTVMAQVMELVEREGTIDVSKQRRMLKLRFAQQGRQELLRSLMPGRDSNQMGGWTRVRRRKDRSSHVTEVVIGI